MDTVRRSLHEGEGQGTSHPITKQPDMVNRPLTTTLLKSRPSCYRLLPATLHYHLQGTILKYLPLQAQGNPLQDLRKRVGISID